MARRTPARNKKGRFVKGSRKRASSRKRAAPAKTTPRRRRKRAAATTRKRRSTVAKRRRAPARRTRRRSTRRRNPGLLGQLRTGMMDAAGIVVGKAGARLIPTLVPGFPKTGMLGLATQAAAAVALGYVADNFVSRDVSRMILAGGLTAPLETAIVAYRIPLLGPALDPVASMAQVAAASGNGVAGFRGARRLASYVTPGLGSYVQPGGATMFPGI